LQLIVLTLSPTLFDATIAADLGVSEITVKVHRGQVIRKMRASSLPDLARMADQLQLTPTNPHNPGRVA